MSNRVRLNPGNRLVVRTRNAVVIHASSRQFVIRFEDTGDTEILTQSAVLNGWQNGEVSLLAPPVPGPAGAKRLPVFELEACSSEEQGQARERTAYCRAIENSGIPLSDEPLVKLSQAVHSGLGKDGTPPSPSTLKRWYQRYRDGNRNPIYLVARHADKGSTDRRRRDIPPDLWAAIQEAVSNAYLMSEKPSIQKACDAAEATVTEWNLRQASEKSHLTPLSRTAVTRILNGISNEVLTRRREGAKTAYLHFRQTGTAEMPSRPLQLVEIDHTTSDAHIFADTPWDWLGRLTVTTVIDRFTGMPLGFYLGYMEPSARTVMAALRHAVFPKTYISREYPALAEKYPNIDEAWPACGMFEALLSDNGREFHSAHLEDAASQAGFNIEYAPKNTPWYKARVERFLGTLNRQLFGSFPGTTKHKDTNAYDAMERARLTLDAARLLMHDWIINRYIQEHQPHLLSSPIQRWNEAGHDWRVPMASREVSYALLGGFATVNLGPSGVKLHGLEFLNTPETNELRHHAKKKAKFVARFDPKDMGRIYLRAPRTGEMLEMTNRYPDRFGGMELDVCRLINASHRQYLRSGRGQMERGTRLLNSQALFKSLILSSPQAKQRYKRALTIQNEKEMGVNPDTVIPPNLIDVTPNKKKPIADMLRNHDKNPKPGQ